jgi:hypothetical protein
MDEYILQDMPDLRPFSEAAKSSQQFLLKLENVLKMIDLREAERDDEDSDDDSDTEPSPPSPESRGAAGSGADPPRAGRDPAATPDTRVNPASDRASGSMKYFELDEEWRKSQPSSDRRASRVH